MSLRRDTIQAALAVVHANERRDGRVAAEKAASSTLGLTPEERAILRRALNLPEIPR